MTATTTTTWATYYTTFLNLKVVRICSTCAERQVTLGRTPRYVNTPVEGRMNCEVCGENLTRIQ